MCVRQNLLRSWVDPCDGDKGGGGAIVEVTMEEGGECGVLLYSSTPIWVYDGLCERRSVTQEDLDSRTIPGSTCLGHEPAHVVEIRGGRRAIR
jgi:hypothetical protein